MALKEKNKSEQNPRTLTRLFVTALGHCVCPGLLFPRRKYLNQNGSMSGPGGGCFVLSGGGGGEANTENYGWV